jgi:TRAP-type mannitol/chloroaromatic compound transport system substrate-binding protein
MDRRKFLKGAPLALGTASVAMPAIAQTSPAIRWRMQSAFPKSLDALYVGGEVLSKYVSELTDGKFQVQPFASGEIVGAAQILDSVSGNAVEMGHTASQYYHGKDPTFTLGNGIPFGLNARQMNAWLYQGGGTELLNEFYAKHGIYALPGGNTGGQMGGWYRKEIKTLEDMKGLKLRIGGLAGQILSKLGVTPSVIPGSDVYPALERGTIDAAEFTGPYDDEKLGFVKVAPYYYYPGFWEGSAAVHFFINLAKWNELPTAYKAALTTAAAMANTEVLARYDIGNPKAIRRLVGAGAQLRPFSPEIMDGAFKAANETYDELSAKNPDWKKIYTSMIEYRNDAYTWWQVDEFAYDSYMIRARARR